MRLSCRVAYTHDWRVVRAQVAELRSQARARSTQVALPFECSLRTRRDGEVGELGHAVGLRPEADLPRHGRLERVVEQVLAIEIAGELRAVYGDPDLVPGPKLQRHVLRA